MLDCYPLNFLGNGQFARVAEIEGDSSQVHRLGEIGLRVGSQLQMIRAGQPCLLSVDGRRLSLRLNDDVDILVSCCQSASFIEAV